MWVPKLVLQMPKPQGALSLTLSLTGHHLLGLIGLHVAIVFRDLLWGSRSSCEAVTCLLDIKRVCIVF